MGRKINYEKLAVLVKEAIDGDYKSFAKLCEIQAPFVIYSCTKIMGNRIDGEDAAQEVFVQLQTKITTLKVPEAFVAWLQRIIVFTCDKLRRKNMNFVDALSIEEFGDLFSETDTDVLPEEYLHKREKSKELMNIIDNLPDQIRTCIFMYYFTELKIHEISEALNISEGSVKGYLYVGREKIRKTLKQQDEAAYLNAGNLLPMTSLASLFQQDMKEYITAPMVKTCLEAAGIKIASSLGWFTAPAVKKVLIATVCAAVATGTIAASSYIASNSTDDFQQGSFDPQQGYSVAVSGDEDMATELGATQPEDAQPDPALSGPGWQTPVSDMPSANASGSSEQIVYDSIVYPEPPNAVTTRVTGSLAVKNAETTNITGELFDKQYYAIIEQNGKQLAFAIVDSKGHFTFDDLKIVSSGTYQLCVNTICSQSMPFAKDNPSGSTEIFLTPGQDYTHSQPFLVEDNEAPSVAVRIMDTDGEISPVNPSIIVIDTYDTTKITVEWSISTADGLTAAQGNSGTVSKQTLSGLSKGLYRIQILATDAMGNQTSASGEFYIKSG